MAKDLTVILEDRPGTMAGLGEALGKAGVNIDGICGIPCEGMGIIHILVEDALAARRALEAAGMKVTQERDVLLVDAEDKPGELGEIARKFANAGVNIDMLYKTTQTTIVFVVDDIEKGRAAV